MPLFRVYTLMVLHVFMAAGTYVFSKAAVTGFADPEALTQIRSFFAAVFLAGLSGWAIPKPAFRKAELLQIMGLGLLLVPLNQYCFLRGMADTVPSHPALLYALTPMGVLILASVGRREWPDARTFCGILLALCGVLVVLRPWESSNSAIRMRQGDMWILMAVISWALYTVWARRINRNHPPATVTVWSLVMGACLMLPFSFRSVISIDYTAISAMAWGSLGWLVMVTSVIMMLMWNVLLRHLRPESVSVCLNAQPPATAILCAILAFFGLIGRNQDLNPVFFGGMLMILAGVVLAQPGITGIQRKKEILK